MRRRIGNWVIFFLLLILCGAQVHASESYRVTLDRNEGPKQHIDVKLYGCVYDGVTDDSGTILNIKSKNLYFPEGSIVINSEAAKYLMTKHVCGEGEIIIKDFFIFWDTKFSNTGRIIADDFKNKYIASLNLPGEAIPDTEYIHQRNNGWINENKTLTPGYDTYSLTCWGQVFPTITNQYSGNDLITINIGNITFGYYDDVSRKWVCKEKLPDIYGLYYANFKKIGAKGKDYTYSDKLKITKNNGYVTVTVKQKYLRDRMLHYGWTTTDIPKDRELYVKGSYDVWLDNDIYPESFVANIGFDFRVTPTGSDGSEKIIKEYCGSRSIVVSDTKKKVCLAYVEDNYELLR